MENEVVQSFVHERFGKIRTLTINGVLWFVAADICRSLDIKNSRDALSRLDDDEKKIVDLNSVANADGSSDATSGGWIKNEVNVVNEPGMYRLIFSSRKPEAKEFQRWIYHEVIPSIRKTGSYTLPNEEPALKNLPPHLADPKRLCVYAVAMSDDTVKIGKTNDYRRRANELKRESALEILRAYRTGYLPSRIASDIESDCLRAFDSCRKHGEFLNASFAKVCAKVSERAIAIIETDRAIYVTKWPDAKAEYDQFISEIPATETGDTSELSLKEKLCVLLECARITNSDTFRDEILREAIAITIGKQF